LSGLGRLTILVIDDNAQMRSIIGAVLAAMGVKDRHFAPDGQRGLEAVRQVRPDIVFCDYEMPRMNGLDVLSGVRALPDPLCYTPVIMLTGHSDLPRLTAARDRGVTEFLTKPVSAANIARRLDAVILRPRDFVRAAGYFGPDRRRRADAFGAEQGRRRGDHVETVEI
jgi:two-component system chemotaxis response regulator CheY